MARLAVVLAVIVLCCVTPGLQGQLGPCAVPIGPDLPDLIVDANFLKTQMYVTEETFSAAGCTVREGCVSGPDASPATLQLYDAEHR